MSETEWDSLLQQDIAEDEKIEADAIRMEYVDRVTTAAVGSFLCRDLVQYRDILFSNGTPNYMEAYPNGVVVDAGASCGYALAQLRFLLPNAVLVANDVRNTPVTKYILEGTPYSVAEMYRDQGIYFVQGSMRRMPQLVPNGYDYLTSVVAFPDSTTSAPYQAHVIETLYRGLNSGGVMQVLYEPTKEQFKAVERYCSKKRIPFSFVKTPRHILERQLGRNDAPHISGTLTIGPK